MSRHRTNRDSLVIKTVIAWMLEKPNFHSTLEASPGEVGQDIALHRLGQCMQRVPSGSDIQLTQVTRSTYARVCKSSSASRHGVLLTTISCRRVPNIVDPTPTRTPQPPSLDRSVALYRRPFLYSATPTHLSVILPEPIGHTDSFEQSLQVFGVVFRNDGW
jgi:hypothetical protein